MIGVYIVRDKTGAAIYVGSSGCIEKRLAYHGANAQWWPKDGGDIETIETANRSLAFYRERELIKSLDPSANIMARGVTKVKSKDLGPAVRPRPEGFATLIEAYGSVAALAREVSVDHMTLSDIWRGVHYPSSKVIARLIVVTGIPFDELFYIEASDVPIDEWTAKRAPRVSRNARPVAVKDAA